ncbi:MAG: 4Fe-4S binding protein [Bacteroidales bacterium]|nr:4Fe-4S binding protein [Bacteroidales bacterium]
MYRHLKRIRVIGSVVFLALLTYTIIDASFALTRIGQIVLKTQLVPSILAGAAIWLVLWLLITLTFGRVYCSSVCPLGTLQDAAARCGVWCRKGTRKYYRYAAPLNALRIPIAIAVGACLLFGFTFVVTLTDPFTLYSRIVIAIAKPMAIGLGSLGAACIVLAAVGLVAWKRGRLLCNTVCPLGGMLALISRVPVYRIDINTDKCIHCGKCEDVCKSECIDLRGGCVVDNTRCVMCMNCTAVCPNDAITLRRGKYRLSTPMMLATGNQAQCQMKNEVPTEASITSRSSALDRLDRHDSHDNIDTIDNIDAPNKSH